MKTLIIHDNEGFILTQTIGSYRLPVGVPYLEVEVPTGKYISGIDVTGETPVATFGDIPPNQVESLEQEMANVLLELAAIKGGTV